LTDSDLTKYDWRRRLGDGGSGDLHVW